MLPLVGADGHVRGAMDEYVGGLQDRVREEAKLEPLGDVTVEALGVVAQLHLGLFRGGKKEEENLPVSRGQPLVGTYKGGGTGGLTGAAYLPLRHPVEIPHGRRAAENPHEFRVRHDLE